ncbi:apolipoprotein B receptor isoform X2 [Moschus berezovskii]|uniref:apolipoprotein B receptor isoform X2 n=1 Tax=Moschus berezovskii TaxID=68408 RepID=UPI0024440B1B|nr:apolipoprotein B receptor isoform X2 [Moschus berezovskii]
MRIQVPYVTDTCFPTCAGSSCGQGLGWGYVRKGQGKRKCLGSWGRLVRWVGTVIISFLDTQTETDRMDFLRLHLPGLHQALRGALESLSTFVSYLIGDEVPTVERKEACAAEELREVAAGRPLGKAEEEAQEALEGLGGSQSKEDAGLRQPGETGRCWEESSATEQTWGGGEGSSRGSQAERQDPEDWEAAKAIRCQDSGIPLEASKKSEARSEAGQDRRSQALENQEPDEQEVKREETLRTWDLEEEEVRAAEPVAERAWHKKPEGKAGADGYKVAGDGKESEQVVNEAGAGEIQGPEAKGTGREEGVIVVRCGQSTRAQGTQEPGEESEDREALGREEADLPGVEEREYGAVPGERIPEGTGRVWALEETSKRDQEEEVDENRETEASLFPEQTQVLGTGRVEEEAKGQAAGREAEEGLRSVGEVREDFEGQDDQTEEEAVGRQDSEVKAGQASLQEVVRTEEAEEQKKESCSAAEAELPQDKVANEAKGDADLEATPEARPQQFNAGRGEEETQIGDALEGEWGGLEHKVTEGQEPELMGGPQTTTEQFEEGSVGKEELWSILAPSREETGRSLQEYPRHVGHVKPNSSVAEVWGNRGKDVERDDAQEEKGNAEEGEEEATRGQALVVEAAGGRELARPAIPEAGGEWMKAKEAWHGAEEGEAPGAENQEQGRRHGAEAGTSQLLGELDIRETQEEEVEAPGPCGEDRTSRKGWRLEAEAVSPQSSEGPEANSLAAEMVEDKAALDGGALGPGEGPEREAGDAFGRGWDSERREEAYRGDEPVEAAEGEKRTGQEFGLEGSAIEEVPGRGSQAEAPEATLEGEPVGEPVGLGESAGAAGICGVDDFPSGWQALRAEDLPGRQALWEGEAGGWRAGEQGWSCEGQRGNQHPPEGKTQRPLDVEDAGVTGGQRAEATETDPEGLEDVQGQEDQSTDEDPAEAEPGPRGEADGSAVQDAHGKWDEALLPGSRLDVSVSRSRVFLSRSSSQRRSRPSFRRTPVPEPSEGPPSPPPEEEPSAPEQRIQPEQPPEPRPSRPEGTPLPARRSPLGQGFGLAHPGMMQELRARLGQPKPQ